MADFDLMLCETELRVPDGEETRLIFSTSGFTLAQGSVLGVRGASGAGKSTFLKLISGILTPTHGAVHWGAVNLSRLTESGRDRWRGEHCGFLFQDFRLFEDLTAEENVLLPATFTRALKPGDHARARSLLEAQGVRSDTRARYLSRGEMQRTALARVLFAEPQVILADEPTASLDRPRAAEAVEALLDAARTLGATLILVSHDERVLMQLPRLVEIADGRLIDLSARR